MNYDQCQQHHFGLFLDAHVRHSSVPEQQQPIKGLRDVNGGLVDSANNANNRPPHDTVAKTNIPAVTAEHSAAAC